MTNEQAIVALECIAINMTGAIMELKENDPYIDVLKQRIKAIDMAQKALKEK